MATMNRRDFFKVAGLTGAAGLTACDVQTPVEKLYPYVVQPDQLKPGIPTYFSTVCGGCASACGAVAKNVEGRTIFLAGNPDAPSGGGLCASGVAGVQDIYDPERVLTPTAGGSPKAWDASLDGLAKAIAASKESGKKVVWLGKYRTGALGKLISDFVSATGGQELHWEPLGYEALVKATELAFGLSGAPRYAVDEAKVIVGFGADFLHTWLSPLAQAKGWAAARNPEKGGFVAEYYEIAPTVSHTATRCDTWWTVKPGAEAGVAMALAKLVATRKGSDVAKDYLAAVDPAALADAAGVPLTKLETLADKLANSPSIVFPGGPSTNGVNGTHLALATLVLNAVCGNVGKTLMLTQRTNLGKVSSYAEVEALFADLAADKVGVLLIDDIDPVFSLPASVNAFATLEKLPNLFIFSNQVSDSFTGNATVLPPGTSWESWGDAEAVVGHYGLQQPTMKSLGDTRDIGDVLLGLAKTLKLGALAPVVESPTEAPPAAEGAAPVDAAPAKDAAPAAEAPVAAEAPAAPAIPPLLIGGKTAIASFEAEDFYRYLVGYWHLNVYSQASSTESFEDWWVNALKRGGFFTSRVEESVSLLASLPKGEPGVATANATSLVLFPSEMLFDGRNANKAWMQEIPDPVSGYTWGTWAELSPGHAKKLGVTEKDSVVVSANGVEYELGLRISKGLPDGVVTVVLGNGHERGNRYSKGWGHNGFRFVKAEKDPVSGALSYAGIAAEVKRGAQGNPRKSMVGSESMDHRPVALISNVEDVLSGKYTETSSLAGIHRIPEDPRLVAKGMHDMYPEPEHPTYRFAMSINLDTCTGCGACQAACFSENNISITGPDQHLKNRYMNWIRLDRFWEGDGEHPDVRFMPAVCQQCAHAPCEGVCPVVATYHNIDGLNAMIYNRCVGTRYCANNCPYSSRRFNFHTYRWPEAYQLMLNPDVSVREVGVMEKCTFCVQRTRHVKAEWRGKGAVPDTAWQKLTACAEACPTDSITFGNAKEEAAAVTQIWKTPRAYALFGELNTKPGVRYVTKLTFEPVIYNHHGGGGHGEDHGDGHAEAPTGHAAETTPHGAGADAGADHH